MPINGKIELPGDKSISHRALILGSLSNDISKIKNLSSANDVISTRNCLKACGINIDDKNDIVLIQGGTFSNPINSLDCGNSGTTARLLLGLLTGNNISATLIGDKSLSNRPMNRIIKPLEQMGAAINSNAGSLPIRINKSKGLNPIDYSRPIVSAQIKSAIIIASIKTIGTTTIHEKYKSRDHTEIMLKNMGVDISIKDRIIINNNKNNLKSVNIEIPGDPSSAAYFIGAAAMIPSSHLVIKNILCNPTRIKYVEIINKMGGNIKIKNKRRKYGELFGDIEVAYKPLRGITINKNIIPQIIDEIPILSIIASQASGYTLIKGIDELRCKECDRVEAIEKNLSNMGGEIHTTNSSISINGPNILHNTTIRTYNDHRISMAFAIAGLLTGKYNNIDNTECISTSFPDFFNILKEIA